MFCYLDVPFFSTKPFLPAQRTNCWKQMEVDCYFPKRYIAVLTFETIRKKNKKNSRRDRGVIVKELITAVDALPPEDFILWCLVTSNVNVSSQAQTVELCLIKLPVGSFSQWVYCTGIPFFLTFKLALQSTTDSFRE